jgi:glutathione S-transferase
MALVNLLVILALFQYFFFAACVGKARGTHSIAAPATTGHPVFERYYRVQTNTLEMLIMLIPGVWIASTYWNPLFTAAMLAIYLIGRQLYFSGYVKDPSKRSMGFLVSFLPITLLLLAGVAGALWTLYKTGI